MLCFNCTIIITVVDGSSAIVIVTILLMKSRITTCRL
uniref:Uncharacterized protein n=1 Tax=Anguilla anguilla TaxID=7936 RepID=A0A0E9VES8_ANGAN